MLIADSPGGCSDCFTWRIATAARTGTTSSRRNAKLSCSGDTATPRLLRAKWRTPWGEPLKISPEFRYLGVQMARQVETRGAARTMAEVRRRELIDKVHGEGKSMNLLRVSAADPVMTPLDTRQVYLGNCLGPHLYAAASEVRGLSELADAMQRDAGRIIMRLPSRQHGRSPTRLSLPDAAAVKATCAFFQHVHRVPRGCALRRFDLCHKYILYLYLYICTHMAFANVHISA